MAIKITDECINCGACEPECPNNAIYESGVGWKFSEGTSLNANVNFNGKTIDPNKENPPIQDEFFYIVTDKCTECNGFYDEPQCAAVCPVGVHRRLYRRVVRYHRRSRCVHRPERRRHRYQRGQPFFSGGVGTKRGNRHHVGERLE